MTNATIWEGQDTLIPVVNALGNTFEEWQTATGGQTVVILNSFQYTPGTNTLLVFKNGLFQQIGVAYLETNSTRVTFTAPLVLGDKIAFFAWATEGTAIPNGGGVPAGGATGQALVKASNNDYDSTWITLTALASLLDSPISNVASANTVDLSPLSTTTRNIAITGNVNIAGFQIGNGNLFCVRFTGTLTLINSVNLVTQKGANLQVFPGDTCFIRGTATNVAEIIAFQGAGNLSSQFNYTFRNLAMNGLFELNEYAAGAVSASASYFADRWQLANTAAVSTVQAGVTVNIPQVLTSAKITSTAATVPAAASFWNIQQGIEGNILRQARWGTGIAKTVTISFWVYCSIAGTYSVSLRNFSTNRSYIAPFTVNAPNTAEYKTITVPGDTVGAWATDTTAGVTIGFCYGVGTTFATTGGSWQAGNFIGLTGQTNLVGTNGATMEISQVQVEIGTIATAYEQRPLTIEQHLCRRYYWALRGQTIFGPGQCTATTAASMVVMFPTEMRVSPAVAANVIAGLAAGGGANNFGVAAIGASGTKSVSVNLSAAGAVFVAGNATIILGNAANAFLTFFSDY